MTVSQLTPTPCAAVPERGGAPSAQEFEPGSAETPWRVLRAHSGMILLSYGLFAAENVVRLAQPAVLGQAIDDIFRQTGRGTLLLSITYLAYIILGWIRRMYDTRVFGHIYVAVTTPLVLCQRKQQVPASMVVARSALAREIVDFFERDVPVAVAAFFSLAGALLMIGYYDPLLLLMSVAVVISAFALCRRTMQRCEELNGRLNDQLEHEVRVIQESAPAEIKEHYKRLACWRVRLSDWDAANFGLMELLTCGLLLAAFLRSGWGAGGAVAVGEIVAVMRYVILFETGVITLPVLAGQLSRLRDIGRRVHAA